MTFEEYQKRIDKIERGCAAGFVDQSVFNSNLDAICAMIQTDLSITKEEQQRAIDYAESKRANINV